MSVVTAVGVACCCWVSAADTAAEFPPCGARVPGAGVRESALCARSSDMRLGRWS